MIRPNVFVSLILLAMTSGCLPAVSVIEGAKQLGGYAYQEVTEENDKYLINYTDKQVCLSATTIDGSWDEKNAAQPFVREAKRRKFKENCREIYRARRSAELQRPVRPTP